MVTRKFLAGILLTTFLVATTGFVLIQCCCDLSPKQECCRAKNSDGCKDQVSYFKLKADYQASSLQKLPVAPVTMAADAVDLFCFSFTGNTATRPFTDSGPPDHPPLTTQSRLQVFRI